LKFLLDTHALAWWLSQAEAPSRVQRRAFASASATSPLAVSDISLWEIAALHERKRLQLALSLREWLERATAVHAER
jgi:PIN domain nuclease of toxin-antitoxin system